MTDSIDAGKNLREAMGSFARLRQALTRRDAVRGMAAGVALGVAARALPPSAVRAGERIVATATAFRPSTRTIAADLPAALEGVPLDPAAGFDIDLGRFTASFIPRAGLLGRSGDPAMLLAEPMVVGMVVTCLDEIWWLESEPAGARTINLTAFAEGGDGPVAMLRGEGTLGDGVLSVSLHTSPALLDSPRQERIDVRVRAGGDGGFDGAVTADHFWNKHHGHGRCHRRCDQKQGKARRNCKRRCHHNRS